MSIGKRITDAVNKMQADDTEGALFAICAAIEATAKKEYGSGGRSNYKKFIRDNLELITSVALDGKIISSLHLGYSHPELKPSSDGAYPFEDILYHAIRCGFYHEAKMPQDIIFASGMAIGVNQGKITLPISFIHGLMVAIIASPHNSTESADENCMFKIGGFSIPFSKIWGMRDEMRWLMSIRNELQRIANKSASLKTD